MRIQIKALISISLLMASILSLTGCDQRPRQSKPLTPYEQGVSDGTAQTEDRFKNSYLTLQLERDLVYRSAMQLEVAKLEACEAYLSICPNSVVATGLAAKRAGFTSGDRTIAGPILGLKIFVITCLALSTLSVVWLLLVFILGPAYAIFNNLDAFYKSREMQLRAVHDEAVSVLAMNQADLYAQTASVDKQLEAKESLLANFESVKRKEWASLEASISAASQRLGPLQSSLAVETKALNDIQSLIAKAKTRLDSMILTQSLSQNLKDPETKAALIKIAAARSEDTTG
jgi:hypothetical protein